MRINVTVLILAALMAGLVGCDESLQLEWNDALGTRNAAWTGIENRGTLTLINASPQTILHQTVGAGSAVTFIVTSKMELDTTKSALILTTRGKQYDAALALIDAPFILPGIRNYRASFTPQNDTPSGLYTISATLWESGGARQHLTLGKLNLTVEGDTAPPVITNMAVAADSSPIRVGGVITLLFSANEALDIANTQAIFTIAGEQHAQSVTLVPNTEYRYQAMLTVTDAVPDGTLEEVVVAAYDAAGNSERFTQSADLTIEKVAPPPPDTTPPVVSDIAITSETATIRLGGVITLLFSANEALDTANTQVTFTIAGEQRAQSVTLVPNTEYRYQTTLTVTDAVPDGTLEEVVVAAYDVAGNSERFTQAANLTIEKVAPPPPDTTPPMVVAVSATSDNEDSAIAEPGNTVTLTIATDEPIVIGQSQMTFIVANSSHGRALQETSTANQYTAQLRITNAMPAGVLRASLILEDAAGNKSGAIVRETTLTIVPPPDTAPPVVVSVSATSDNADSTIAVSGNTVTLTVTTDEPIVIGQSKLTFNVANSSHGGNIRAAADAANRYTAQLQITETMPAGVLRASLILEDASGNRSDAP